MGVPEPEPDARSQYFVVLAPDGPRPISYGDRVRESDQWAVTTRTPEGIAGLLRTTRATFALAVYHYELFVVAATWSLLAIEAALRERYDADKAAFKQLLGRAREDGLLDSDWFERLAHGRRLRNELVHARLQGAWTPAMASGVIQASHEAVARIYPDECTSEAARNPY